MSIANFITAIPHISWEYIFKIIHQKKYFQDLKQLLEQEYSTYTIFPPSDQIFNAFKICHYDMIKIVIMGQDPYINPGQANGLAFSVNNNQNIPKTKKKTKTYFSALKKATLPPCTATPTTIST